MTSMVGSTSSSLTGLSSPSASVRCRRRSFSHFSFTTVPSSWLPSVIHPGYLLWLRPNSSSLRTFTRAAATDPIRSDRLEPQPQSRRRTAQHSEQRTIMAHLAQSL